MTTSNDRAPLIVSNPVARKALAIGATRAGGSVLGALDAYLKTPRGDALGHQAWDQLTDAIALAVRDATIAEVDEAAADLSRAARMAKRPHHPSRALAA